MLRYEPFVLQFEAHPGSTQLPHDSRWQRSPDQNLTWICKWICTANSDSSCWPWKPSKISAIIGSTFAWHGSCAIAAGIACKTDVDWAAGVLGAAGTTPAGLGCISESRAGSHTLITRFKRAAESLCECALCMLAVAKTRKSSWIDPSERLSSRPACSSRCAAHDSASAFNQVSGESGVQMVSNHVPQASTCSLSCSTTHN